MLETLKIPRFWLAFGGMFVAGTAWAFPWDIDMVDSRGYRAYEWVMRAPIPEGSVQRPEGAIVRARGPGGYQNDFIAKVDMDPAKMDALTNPYPTGEATVATGKKLFQTSCAPCHGIAGKGGGPVAYNDAAKNIRRWTAVPPPMLSGKDSTSASRSDGSIYNTIRNGKNSMPPYGASLTDQERWSIVTYMRTLDGAAYVPTVAVDSAVIPAAIPALAPATEKGTSL